VVKVRVTVQTSHSTYGSAWFEYVVHVVNRSRHALRGAVRAGFRKYPNACNVEAAFVEAA
jgi:hypothetical protein